MKKQIISIVFLFILIVPAIATYSWLQQKKRAVKKEVKQEMIAGIDKSELVFFKFSKVELNSKLRWEHHKEFEYNHQMYDVVTRITEKDSVLLWCWWDSKETKLNIQLQQLLEVAFNNDSTTKEKQNQIIIFYKGLYYQPLFSWLPIGDTNKTILIFSKIIRYRNVFSQINSPPPEFV